VLIYLSNSLNISAFVRYGSIRDLENIREEFLYDRYSIPTISKSNNLGQRKFEAKNTGATPFLDVAPEIVI